MLTLNLTRFYFKFMLVIDFAKSSEGEFVREDIQCKRSLSRLFVVVVTVQSHTCVFLDTETGQYLRELPGGCSQKNWVGVCGPLS